MTEIDEGNGVVKTYWKDIRDRISNIEPTFSRIVDELNPGKEFPLYLAYYPYGTLKGDTKSTFLPKAERGFYRLSDTDIPKDIRDNLGYGKSSAPLAMLLDKSLELFIDLKHEGITIPRILYTPGSFFPFARILSRKSTYTYAPNGVLTMTAGARSVFMLSNIGCATNHLSLQRDFNIQTPPPKSLYDHWHVFRQIVNSDAINSSWRACLMYFSQNWLDKLYAEKAWLPLKLYLHELAWKYYEFQRNQFYYDFVFSIIQKRRNLKPNPYLADTAQHLFSIAIGAAPGYVPACDTENLPADILKKVFVDSYGMKKYFPIIFHPAHYKLENVQNPIYYSLQYPSTHAFSPKSRKLSSTLTDMRELEHITKVFRDELSNDEGMCSDTILNFVANNIKFNYFHNKLDGHRIIKPSEKMYLLDTRFAEGADAFSGTFASDGPFARGCISIQMESLI
jgi:hypothetical protein